MGFPDQELVRIVHFAWRRRHLDTTNHIVIPRRIPLIANAFEFFEFATFAYEVEPISHNFSNGYRLNSRFSVFSPRD
eukprot:416542-Amorphochlora_amoeboformis.AAC.1